MLIKTHLTITLFFILLLLPFVSYKIFFIAIALLATYIPDIDLKSSKLGRKIIFRPLQYFVKHRGAFHSFTFLFLITFIFLMFIPRIALGFFVGYASHLFADSLTISGITPFFPLKGKTSWKIRTGGKTEKILFFVLLIVNLLLIVRYIFAN
ncbi:MAG TPA: metal-dependent hydrolase [Candidatus Nanoarchaeia archaeon]|nr:metal-dependent hydrolase [Candidatus Nanoarchaeia archaeon]